MGLVSLTNNIFLERTKFFVKNDIAQKKPEQWTNNLDPQGK